MTRPYDTIFIDWYGTLSTSHFWHTWQPHKKTLLDDLNAAFVNVGDTLGREWSLGHLTVEEYCERLAKIIDHPAGELLSELKHSC